VDWHKSDCCVPLPFGASGRSVQCVLVCIAVNAIKSYHFVVVFFQSFGLLFLPWCVCSLSPLASKEAPHELKVMLYILLYGTY